MGVFMYKEKKITALIPARKGSKGIPNKNIIDLNGHPLIAYSIMEAKKSQFIDKVIVSTDSEEIAAVARSYGAEVKGMRPEEYSNDTAIIYDVMKYEIENHQLVEQGYEIIVLLQPTSPLRKSEMIDNALIQFVDEEQSSAVAVSEVKEHPIMMRTIDENGVLHNVLNVGSTVRRQELPKYYRVNGMLYINKIIDVVNHFVSFNDNISPIIIPEKYNVDIDDRSDLEEARRRLEK